MHNSGASRRGKADARQRHCEEYPDQRFALSEHRLRYEDSMGSG